MNQRPHIALVLLAHAANEGIRAGHFDPAAPNLNPIEPRTSVLFEAPIGSIPMRVSIGAWRFDEARVAVAAWPTLEVDQWIERFGAKELAGDVTAIGYLTRVAGGRLRLADPFDPVIYIRQRRLAAMRMLSTPSDAADPLQLYPRFLSHAAAA